MQPAGLLPKPVHAGAGLGVGLVLSIFWLVLLRYFAGLMAWLTVLAVNLLFAGCTLLCYQKVGWVGAITACSCGPLSAPCSK